MKKNGLGKEWYRVGCKIHKVVGLGLGIDWVVGDGIDVDDFWRRRVVMGNPMEVVGQGDASGRLVVVNPVQVALEGESTW
jgi:hypothetical protein